MLKEQKMNAEGLNRFVSFRNKKKERKINKYKNERRRKTDRKNEQPGMVPNN